MTILKTAIHIGCGVISVASAISANDLIERYQERLAFERANLSQRIINWNGSLSKEKSEAIVNLLDQRANDLTLFSGDVVAFGDTNGDDREDIVAAAHSAIATVSKLGQVIAIIQFGGDGMAYVRSRSSPIRDTHLARRDLMATDLDRDGVAEIIFQLDQRGEEFNRKVSAFIMRESDRHVALVKKLSLDAPLEILELTAKKQPYLVAWNQDLPFQIDDESVLWPRIYALRGNRLIELSHCFPDYYSQLRQRYRELLEHAMEEQALLRSRKVASPYQDQIIRAVQIFLGRIDAIQISVTDACIG